MEPIKIHVEVGLKEDTIQSLGKVFSACIGGLAPARPDLPAKPAVEAKPNEAPAVPAAETAAIDNMTLNAEVKAAQARGVDKAVIKGVFAKYGIASSRDCPDDKRPGLLADLRSL